MTSEELLKIFEPLTKIAIDSYVNISVLNKHYVETISQLTGKDTETIKEELKNLLPEQKKKAEEVFKKIIEESRIK